MTISSEPDTETSSPIAQVLALPSFRIFWIAQFVILLVNGAVRFAFLWHAPNIGDVTWSVPLLGFATAAPGFLFALPAGAIADRTNHRIYCVVLSGITAALLLITGLLLLADSLSLYPAVIMSLCLGAAGAASMPVFQAMVPRIVPPELLSSGVAIQNLGMMASMIIGAILGGGLIETVGSGPAFCSWALLVGISGLLFVLMRYDLGARSETTQLFSQMIPDIGSGIRYCFANEPLRSLTIAGFITGIGGGAYGTLTPEIGRDQLGLNAASTSLMFGLMSAGMIVSTLYIANKKNFTSKGRFFLFAINCFGPGLMFIGYSELALLTLIFLPIWGLCGGILMTTQRTLLQENTSPDFMARVMGMNVFTMAGMAPLSSLIIWILRNFLSAGGTLSAFGFVVMCSALFLAFTRRSLWQKAL